MAGQAVDINADGVVARRSGDGITHSVGHGAPTNGLPGFAKGGQYTDMTNAVVYLNSGTQDSATWITDTVGSSIAVDTISEFTNNSGVTVDGVLLQNNNVDLSGTGASDDGAIIFDIDSDTYIGSDEVDDTIRFYAANSMAAEITEGTLAIPADSLLHVVGAGTGTGDVVQRIGGTATEGLELRVYEVTVVPEAVETNLILTPANSRILSVQSNVATALTGGGTTDSYGIGIAADPDKYGSSATLTANSKSNFIGTGDSLTGAEQMVLTGTASQTTDGDTALTVGSVRVRVVYYTLNPLDDAA